MHKKLVKKFNPGGSLAYTIPTPPSLSSLVPGIDMTGLQTLPNSYTNPYTAKSILGKNFLFNNSFGNKFSQLFNNTNLGSTMSVAGGVSSALGNFIPKTEQSALTTGLNSGYDIASNAVMAIPGIGTAIGGAMKIGGMLSDGLTALGVGTDQMTTTDKILDSKFLKLTPVGLINSIGAKKSDTITKDNSLWEKQGSSYGGTLSDVDNAVSKSGKKYGLFSRKALGNTNEQIKQAKIAQEKVGNINNKAQEAFSTSNNPLLGIGTQFQLSGGYQQNGMRFGRLGLKFPTEEEIQKVKLILQKGGHIRNIDELIEYAKKQNPRFIQRLSEPPRGIKFIDDNGNESEGSHYLESAGEYVIPRIQEVGDSLKFFNHEDAVNRAIETGNYLKMAPEEAIIFAKEYKKGWPQFFKSFKQGGKMNVIPEGALHARLHHMDVEGITKKGIPVITKESGGEIVQHAEIERDEIIFTKEVTEKLEELYKKGTDEAAIEAGKILAREIMENTQDNTGLMQTIS